MKRARDLASAAAAARHSSPSKMISAPAEGHGDEDDGESAIQDALLNAVNTVMNEIPIIVPWSSKTAGGQTVSEHKSLSAVRVAPVEAIYDIIRDRAVVDKTIDALAKKDILRLCHSPFGLPYHAVIYCSELSSYMDGLVGTLGADEVLVVQFWRDLWLNYKEPWITLADIQAHIPTSPALKAAARPYGYDDIIRVPMRRGWISSREDGTAETGYRSKSFWFCVPESAFLWSSLLTGTLHLEEKLRRTTYHEMQRAELEKVTVARGVVGAPVCVRLLLSGNNAKEVPTGDTVCVKLLKVKS